MKITISLAQLQIQLGQPEKNFNRAAQMVAKASQSGSSLVLLPELWTSGYDLVRREELNQANQQILPDIQQLAQEFHTWIGGSTIYKGGENYYNALTLQSPEENPLGKVICYKKTHLFPLMDEPTWFAPGDQPVSADLPWGQAGLAICYDLRFPELFRGYALSGARMFVLSAEWPGVRIANWQILLRARAIENQVYVVATNCVGPTGGNVFGGRSAIIAPTGDMIAEGSNDSEDLITAEIDLEQVDRARQAIPVYHDRRPEIYGSAR